MANNLNCQIIIRLADFSDATDIADLLKDSFSEYKNLYTKRAFTETVLGVYKIKERIYNKRTWIILIDGAITGTISLIPAQDTLYIKSVAVAPMARGRGLGKLMLDHAEHEAKRMRLRYLELTTTHFLSAALRLYENFGFEQRGQKDLYGTPLIRMIKDLRPGVFSPTKPATSYDNQLS
jgi:ribosomal protein S18 acetylase RimI-like enzyme